MARPSVSTLHLMDVAELAARAAGTVARDRFTGPRNISVKGFRDIVTDADIAAQSAIVDIIRARFPDHAFLTEEEDRTLSDSGPFLWIVDPIDGTTNYSRRQPVFCVSVAAAMTRGTAQPEVMAAAVYDPMQDEMFTAGRDLGAFLNGSPIQVSEVATLAESVVAADWGHSHATRGDTREQVNRVADQVNTIRAFGSAVLAMAWVAAARLDAYLNNGLKPWDLAAAQLLIEEAGGIVTNLDGSIPHLGSSDYACLCCNRPLHTSLLANLRA